MDRKRKSRRTLIGGSAFMLAFLPYPALAFTPVPVEQAPQVEQKSAPVAPPSVAPTPAPGLPVTPQGLVIQPFSANKGSGVEINIPGMGAIGSLPKLDLGLELLYGPQNNNFQAPQIEQRNPDNDVQIKGTFKHKF